MIVITWAVTIILWFIAGAFIISDILLALMLFHHRRDREMVITLSVIILMFAMFCAGAAYTALVLGRQLA